MRTSLKDRLGRLSRSVSVLAILLTAACPGASTPTGPGTSPTAGPIAFNAVSQLQGTVGQAFSYSFCKPDLASVAALCGTQAGGTTSPTGGQPTYHFQLGSGVGFPPIGLTLNLNGILSGTPTNSGTSTFSVCAVDLAGKSACSTVSMTVVGTVAVGKISWACTISATPLPGWRNCTATVGLTISKPIQSGYVSVFFNYPSNGAFFHGELAVNSGGPAQSVTVNLVNEYVSQCVTTYSTTVDVYDGRQTAGQAPLIVSVPVTLTSTCP
jgi:hypothetical protein